MRPQFPLGTLLCAASCWGNCVVAEIGNQCNGGEGYTRGRSSLLVGHHGGNKSQVIRRPAMQQLQEETTHD